MRNDVFGNQGGLATLTVSSRFWKTAEDDNIVFGVGIIFNFSGEEGYIEEEKGGREKRGVPTLQPFL
jgi:hypothetical protein